MGMASDIFRLFKWSQSWEVLIEREKQIVKIPQCESQSLPLISSLWNVENTWIKYQDNIWILTYLTDLWKWLSELTHVSCLYQFLTHFKQDMLLFCCVPLNFLLSPPVCFLSWSDCLRMLAQQNEIITVKFLERAKISENAEKGYYFNTWLRSGLLREWTVLVWRDTRGVWI